MLDTEYVEIGSSATVETPFGMRRTKVVPRPFYDPQKLIVAA